MLRSFAPAKVNLFLRVTGRRNDGYHLLDSLVVFAAIGDSVSLEPAPALSLDVGGRFGTTLGCGPDNLVLRAARLLGGRLGIAAAGRLHLEKNLPVASGIGGGSADAAAALRLLARAWGVEAPPFEIALALGADVPVCLGRRPARMAGIGEQLSPSPVLPEFGLMLVNPGIPIATVEVFRSRTGGFSAPAELPAAWTGLGEMVAALRKIDNDLEAAAIALAPGVAEVLAVLRALPGVLLARMSGSGATVFAIFETPAAASRAARAAERPGWWCWGGGLYEPGPADL